VKILLKILSDQTDNTFIQLFRYTFVGGLAFIVDFGLLYLLTDYAGLYYLVSAAISFLAGLTVNYLLSIRWVFHAQESREHPWMDFGMFAVIGVIGLVLNAVIIYVCAELLTIHYLIAKIISTILVFLWNFLGRKYLLSNMANLWQKK
jgi:putative flippase GtrA